MAKKQKLYTFTTAERSALHDIAKGADVLALGVATTLRRMHDRYPELIWIGDAIGTYDVNERQPYFGAKLKDAGLRVLGIELPRDVGTMTNAERYEEMINHIRELSRHGADCAACLESAFDFCADLWAFVPEKDKDEALEDAETRLRE